MKRAAGLLTLGCAWLVILIQELAAGSARNRDSTRASCSLKDQMAVTRYLLEESLLDFDKANGKDLGTWQPGFPMLQVHHNSTPHWPRVQCSLLFMAQGLETILEDQETNLNPNDVSLHRKLRSTIGNIQMLARCVKSVLGAECHHKPPRPTMPEDAFERKQWSRTLLKSATDYLAWLQHKLLVHISKVKGTDGVHRKAAKAAPQTHIGGAHQL